MAGSKLSSESAHDSSLPVLNEIDRIWKADHCITISIGDGPIFCREIRDEASAQLLMQLVERLETIDCIQAGLTSASRGDCRPMSDVFQELREKHGVPG
jgi:hypothetical protein